MENPTGPEMLVGFTLSCVEVVIDGQPHALVDIDMSTMCGPQSPPKTMPTIRLHLGVLETLIADLSRTLQIARGTQSAPTNPTIQ